MEPSVFLLMAPEAKNYATYENYNFFLCECHTILGPFRPDLTLYYEPLHRMHSVLFLSTLKLVL